VADKNERDDAKGGDDEQLSDEELKRAAKKVTEDDDDGDSKADPKADKEDDEPSDEEVQEWLDEVIAVPEVQAVIRKAARDAAKEAGKSIGDVRAELEVDFKDRLEKIETDFRSGKIDREEADEAAAEEAKKAVRAKTDRPSAEDDADKRRWEEQTTREKALRKRELENYKREVLLSEDTTSLIPELVIVTDGVSEDDIDQMVEESKNTFSKVRKQVTKELRAQGWKSPADLRKLADEDTSDSDDEPDDKDERRPPTRDSRSGDALTEGRRKQLRSRFQYAGGKRHH